ncbi:hypothetical protein CL632_02360 [bacterium]|jgi:hypothetical protein|nr:hypothetical protein [bacterium]|tara:strand:+ start:10664 stop:10954 length:291 start_codon:yes stop_codon:yes gene_type:complete
MKKLIYKDIISILVLIVLPWFYLDSSYRLGLPHIDSNYLLGLILIGVLYLLYVNIRSVVVLKGKEKIAPVFFLLIPILVIVYFILGAMAFGNFTGI